MELLEFIMSTMRFTTPILLAALGGLICERAGVINIGLEGLMNFGALSSIYFAFTTDSLILGLIFGMITTMIYSVIHAIASITFKLDQIVSGFVINMLSIGISHYWLTIWVGRPGMSDILNINLSHYSLMNILHLNEASFIGKLLSFTPIMFISIIILLIFIFMFKYTVFGIRLTACGEQPSSLVNVGVSVKHLRYVAVLISGALCGLGGAYLSIENSSVYSESMVAGRGFIALIAISAGGWTPIGVLLSSLVFGFLLSLGVFFQVQMPLDVPSEFLSALPYMLSIIAILFFIRKNSTPESLGSTLH